MLSASILKNIHDLITICEKEEGGRKNTLQRNKQENGKNIHHIKSTLPHKTYLLVLFDIKVLSCRQCKSISSRKNPFKIIIFETHQPLFISNQQKLTEEVKQCNRSTLTDVVLLSISIEGNYVLSFQFLFKESIFLLLLLFFSSLLQ